MVDEEEWASQYLARQSNKTDESTPPVTAPEEEEQEEEEPDEQASEQAENWAERYAPAVKSVAPQTPAQSPQPRQEGDGAWRPWGTIPKKVTEKEDEEIKSAFKTVAQIPLSVIEAASGAVDLAKSGLMHTNALAGHVIDYWKGKPQDLTSTREAYNARLKESPAYTENQERTYKRFTEKAKEWGINLDAETDAEKDILQGAGVAIPLLASGIGLPAVVGATLAAVGIKHAARSLGAEEDTARTIGDLSTLISPAFAYKHVTETFSNTAIGLQKVANKFGLPFLRAMTLDRKPFITAAVDSSVARRARTQMNLSQNVAIEKIAAEGVNSKTLQELGLTRDTAQRAAHSAVDASAAANPTQFSNDNLINKIKRRHEELEKRGHQRTAAPNAEENILESRMHDISPTPGREPTAQELGDWARAESAGEKAAKAREAESLPGRLKAKTYAERYQAQIEVAKHKRKIEEAREALEARKTAEASRQEQAAKMSRVRGGAAKSGGISKSEATKRTAANAEIQKLQEKFDEAKSAYKTAMSPAVPHVPQPRPIAPAPTPKTSTLSQLVTDYRRFGEEVAVIQAKAKPHTPLERAKERSYGFLKQIYMSEIKRRDPKLANQLHEANELTKQAKRTQEAEKILMPFMGENEYGSKKFATMLDSKDGETLKKAIGAKAFSELKEVNKYVKKAEENMHDFVGIQAHNLTSDDQAAIRIGVDIIRGRLIQASGNIAGRLNRRMSAEFLLEPAIQKPYRRFVLDAGQKKYRRVVQDAHDLVNAVEDAFGGFTEFLESTAINEFSEE
jgi:hypothetical protein